MALVPVYAFYFLLEKRGISSRWTDYLPVADSGFKNELVFVLNSINNYLITFFRGQVLVAICDGMLYGTGFLIIGLPYARADRRHGDGPDHDSLSGRHRDLLHGARHRARPIRRLAASAAGAGGVWIRPGAGGAVHFPQDHGRARGLCTRSPSSSR